MPHSADHSINKLLKVMNDLRDPKKGCPWDNKQSWQSLTKHSIEETYELIDAIENGTVDEVKEELGDLLYHLVFYAQIAKEQQLFEFADIALHASEKLIQRHPHVFETRSQLSDLQLDKNWIKQKQKEKQHSSLVEGILTSLPALIQSQKLQNRVATVGFDWPTVQGIFDKLEEEIAEAKEAIESGDQEHIEEELGDCLFVLTKLVQFNGLDAETCLKKANQKFIKRFQFIEQHADKKLEDMALDEMEVLWQEAKKQL